MSTVHACPFLGEVTTSCCHRTPFELPRFDRITTDPDAVTCGRPECEGYTIVEPIDEDDLADVFWTLRWHHRERATHNADGYLCEMAGSTQCLALGHHPDENGEWDEDTHPVGWDVGDPLCPATRFEAACTTCEGPVSDCESQRDIISRDEFWALVGTPRQMLGARRIPATTEGA
ncbi:hypothetical protein [Herbiconiux sp. VKM Ac-2851]|uniref:hypothetical protein n=1 Tax=Herbiconiux sp. VKM Ac-2851 TaxID=2739025 RepID=UPI001566C47A|nr:hypothetical protein [Herbiconiux sp. VKM Ac-2851]NQX36266.1 hypothetical protein [Herbiconiux sp. VKM Ac-2851]